MVKATKLIEERQRVVGYPARVISIHEVALEQGLNGLRLRVA
jgi:hypothetical protein